MDSLRTSIKKWLYGKCPGFAGAFPYFGIKVYFPKGSILFDIACEAGIFEIDNVRLMQALARPNTTIFDIGANIGLMSIPMLTAQPGCRVVAFEPSPNVLPFLERTIKESRYADRWTSVPKAVGDKPGRLPYHISDEANSMYDGIRVTHRSTDGESKVRQVEVEMTTVDETWKALGSPKISLIKCDIEGAEWEMLQGARECLQAERPPLLLEWNANNLAAYNRPPESLLTFAQESNYLVYSIPNLAEIHTKQQLTVQMCLTENFLLYPAEGGPDLKPKS